MSSEALDHKRLEVRLEVQDARKPLPQGRPRQEFSYLPDAEYGRRPYHFGTLVALSLHRLVGKFASFIWLLSLCFFPGGVQHHFSFAFLVCFALLCVF